MTHLYDPFNHGPSLELDVEKFLKDRERCFKAIKKSEAAVKKYIKDKKYTRCSK